MFPPTAVTFYENVQLHSAPHLATLVMTLEEGRWFLSLRPFIMIPKEWPLLSKTGAPEVPLSGLPDLSTFWSHLQAASRLIRCRC